MKKQIIEEIRDMKYLLNYNRGRILSEQPEVKEVKLDDYEEEFDLDMDDKWNAPSPDDDYEDDYEDDEFEELRIDDDMPSYKTKYRYSDDMEIGEDIDFEVPTMMPGTKEKERIKIDPGTKPKEPKTPYKPKPGPKPDPKAGRKGEMPNWLSFDELGIDFE